MHKPHLRALLNAHLQISAFMHTIEIEGPEAVLLLTLLGPFSDALAEQLAAQVQAEPQGSTAWADSADLLAVATRLVHKLSRATTTTTTTRP
jgi:hypothetical protein